MADEENKHVEPTEGVEKKKKKKKKTHTFMVQNCKFEVSKHYTPVKKLGTGAYGVVCAATDTRRGKNVAIKKVENYKNDIVDGKRILREVKLLRHFNRDKHPDVIEMVDLSVSTSGNDIYIFLDMMETDLHKIIYSKNELTDDHIKYFVYQILRGMKYIHSCKVLHRDLKPSNLLVNSSCKIKICDFGLARAFTEEDDDGEITEYVVTRWYRAPEVMCASNNYDSAIDVWSIGCIMAELHGRKPLFPGTDYIQQMNLIVGTLGTPTPDDMSFITNARAREYLESLEKTQKQQFRDIYPNASDGALDVMEAMLKFNPNHRSTIDELLAHPYFKNHHDVEQESCSQASCDLSFEKTYKGDAFTNEKLAELMQEEANFFRPSLDEGPSDQ